jgi:hypothetical protein
MKPRFDQVYLCSAGIILAVTGLGKVPSLLVLYACIEEPVLGVHQPFGLSNMGLTGFAAGAELAILMLIFFSPIRWLPCLASGLWGSLCLLARLFFMKEGAHCHCLGWIEAPTVTVAAIAGWLAVWGGRVLDGVARFQAMETASQPKSDGCKNCVCGLVVEHRRRKSAVWAAECFP